MKICLGIVFIIIHYFIHYLFIHIYWTIDNMISFGLSGAGTVQAVRLAHYKFSYLLTYLLIYFILHPVGLLQSSLCCLFPFINIDYVGNNTVTVNQCFCSVILYQSLFSFCSVISTVNIASCLLGSAQSNMATVKSKLLRFVTIVSCSIPIVISLCGMHLCVSNYI